MGDQQGLERRRQAGGIGPLHYLAQHGCTLVTTYQPASRFWLFQWIGTS